MPFDNSPMRLHRASSAVKRFHVMRTHRTQTVGEHSHGVAVLVMQVLPECSATLLKAALVHDFHERSTGDIPTTAKWMYPDIDSAVSRAERHWNKMMGLDFELSLTEELTLKFCDYMELLLFCIEELELGNRYASEGALNISGVLTAMNMPNDKAKEMRNDAIAKAHELMNSAFTGQI